jgi:hypothetical protein
VLYEEMRSLIAAYVSFLRLRSICLLSLGLFMILIFTACAPLQTPLPPEPTHTPVPATSTPTPTIVWFPATSTPTPFATPVVTPTLDLSPPMGAILLSDDFSDENAWTLSKSVVSSSALGVNELTLALHQPGGYIYSLRNDTLLSDFYLEITASPNLCRGPDEYGLLLRVSPSMEFYRFSLTCDGQVRLDKYFNGVASSPQPLTPSGAVPPGAPSSSRLAVWAKGREMRFYANGEYLFTVSDPSLRNGGLGVFARSNGENDLTVSFSDLVVRQPSN